jgi:hypothetical protein
VSGAASARSASTAAIEASGASAAATASSAVAARGSTQTRDVRPRTRLRSSGLEQKAAAETGWVIDDLRRIAVISAIMLVGLAAAWVVLVVVGIGDFY